MNEDNPFKASDQKASAFTEPQQEAPVSDTHAAYNAVSDLVGGVNVRKKDNYFQAKFIGISVLLGAAIGVGVSFLPGTRDMPWIGGLIIGSFAGLVIGFFASGIFLMIYRGVRHAQGKHD